MNYLSIPPPRPNRHVDAWVVVGYSVYVSLQITAACLSWRTHVCYFEIWHRLAPFPLPLVVITSPLQLVFQRLTDNRRGVQPIVTFLIGKYYKRVLLKCVRHRHRMTTFHDVDRALWFSHISFCELYYYYVIHSSYKLSIYYNDTKSLKLINSKSLNGHLIS